MNPSLDMLNTKLAELEGTAEVSEFHIASEIEKLRNTNSDSEPCPEWKFEWMAFSFCEDYKDKPGGWGTYFGPISIWRDGEQWYEWPSISSVDKPVLDYWEKRSKTAEHPLLKARYSGLVWDLTRKATEMSPGINSAVDCVNALLDIAEKQLHKSRKDTVEKLERALSISLSINNSELIQRAARVILDYERGIADDPKQGLFGFSFDFLVGNKKVALAKDEEDAIIADLENRFSTLEHSDTWLSEMTAERLAKYYRSKGRFEEVKRVITSLGRTFETAVADIEPLRAYALLERMHGIYLEFNLRDEAERLSKAIRDIGPKVVSSMKAFSSQIEIPTDEFDRHIEQCVQKTMEQALTFIAIHYIPKRSEVQERLNNMGKNNLIQFDIPKRVFDHEGRVVTKVEPLDEDLDGNTVHQMTQNMQMVSLFLGAVLDRAIEKYEIKSDKLVDYLFMSPIITGQQKSFLVEGITAYIQKQFSIAIHMLVPQIEAVIRNLVRMSGGSDLKSARGGGFHLKTLDELLRSEEIIPVLLEDAVYYLRTLLSDPRGWNIRNDVCHGMSHYEQMSKDVADRLVHVLLLLALVKVREI